MSEEEDNGDGFVRHRQSWRSQAFNRFIEEIDARLTKGPKTTARKREYGTECDRPVPERIAHWMRATSSEHSGSGDGGHVSDELFSTGDEHSE